MPLYEYRCLDCGRLTSLLVRAYKPPESPCCARCGSARVRRTINRVAVLRSEESRMDDLADPTSFADVDENDPRSVARWARKMGAELGEDAGDDFKEMVDQIEAGEMPEGLSDQADEGEF